MSKETSNLDDESTLDEFMRLLGEAREGSEEAMGQLLNQHRNYLLLIVNKELDPTIRSKVGSSDIVQESLLSAHRNFEQFEGVTKAQLMAWLRKIALNDVFQACRTYKETKKRSVSRERQINFQSSIAFPLVDKFHTPKSTAIAAEEAELLNRAIETLPEDYQQVLKLRNWQQLGFEEIGKIMGRKKDAVRKTWTRAVLKLQEALEKN